MRGGPGLGTMMRAAVLAGEYSGLRLHRHGGMARVRIIVCRAFGRRRWDDVDHS